MAGVQIEHRKADYKVFGGFFCWNFYLKGCTSCCDGLAMCTCIACDCSVPMTSINVPALCSVLGITIYPSCACCNDVENIHKNIKKQGKELNPAKFGAKQPYRPCVACCVPGMCSINTYWLSPESCLACEATMAFLSLDGAVPPRDDIPKTCGGAMCIGPYGMPIGIPFLMCYPKCGCCLTVKDLVPNKIAPEPLDIEPIKAITAPPPNVQMTVVRQQPMVVMRQGVQVIMVPVPFNAMPGAMLQIIHPQTGRPMYVTVPPGAMPGQCFPVQIQVTQAVAVGGPSAPDAEVMHKDD